MEWFKKLNLLKENPAALSGCKAYYSSSKLRFSLITPIDGAQLAWTEMAAISLAAQILEQAREAFLVWRQIPAPQRGEIKKLVSLAINLSRSLQVV